MTQGFSFTDVVNKDVVIKQTAESILTALPNAIRQVIRINNINAQKRSYKTDTTHKTKELLNAPTDRIALFANEYIPNHFEEGKWITYYLYVNGEKYEVQPINSNRRGVKIIKKGTYNNGDERTLLIDETIKSVKLEIDISSMSNAETPFVSNIKLVTGKGVTE